MRTLNFHGVTSCLVPKIGVNPLINNIDKTFTNNDIIFFDGPIPSINDLYAITSKDELLTVYASSKISEAKTLRISYIQDNSKLRRIIRQDPNAQKIVFEKNGTITWFALCMSEENPEALGSPLLFGDSIAISEEENKIVTIDKLSGNIGDENYLKEFSLILTEVSNSEGV